MTDYDRLEQLAQLHREGVLSDAEFAHEKGRLLSHDRAASAPPRKLPPVAIVMIVGVMIIAAAVMAWSTFRDRPVASPRPDPTSLLAWPPSATPTISPTPPTPSPSPTEAAAGGLVHEGNCHMGECSWSRELARETVGAGVSGRLIRRSLLGGSSDDHGSAITWDRQPHDVYVFCSRSLPSVMTKWSNDWQVEVLDYHRGIPDVQYTSAALYGDTCKSEALLSPEEADAAGYSVIPEERTDVTKPQDIFERADF